MSFHVQRALAPSLVTIYKFWVLSSEELPVFEYSGDHRPVAKPNEPSALPLVRLQTIKRHFGIARDRLIREVAIDFTKFALEHTEPLAVSRNGDEQVHRASPFIVVRELAGFASVESAHRAEVMSAVPGRTILCDFSWYSQDNGVFRSPARPYRLV